MIYKFALKQTWVNKSLSYLYGFYFTLLNYENICEGELYHIYPLSQDRCEAGILGSEHRVAFYCLLAYNNKYHIMPIRCTALPPHQPHYPKAQLPAFKNSLLQRGGVDARSVQKGFTICRCCEKINPQRIKTAKDGSGFIQERDLCYAQISSLSSCTRMYNRLTVYFKRLTERFYSICRFCKYSTYRNEQGCFSLPR